MQLQGEAEELASQGLNLTLIGNGAPRFIESFKEETGFKGRVLTDPSLDIFDAFELTRSKRSVFSLSVLRRGIHALVQGFRQKSVQGNPWQQGGAFVISSKPEVLFAQRLDSAGEDLNLKGIKEAV